MASKTFEQVDVWQKAHAWVLDIYRLSRFPREEMFGLTSQLFCILSSAFSAIFHGIAVARG